MLVVVRMGVGMRVFVLGTIMPLVSMILMPMIMGVVSPVRRGGRSEHKTVIILHLGRCKC